MPASIHILNVSSVHTREWDGIQRKLKSIFNLPVQVIKELLNLQLAYDSSRLQFNSTALIAQILSLNQDTQNKRIAVVDVDLYIPILTFVFGEAQLDGTAAIVSTQRLSNQFYGLEANHTLLIERLEKEIIHELSHTFGLIHCHQFECVMRSSTYVEEIDLKRADLCANCNTELQEKIKTFVEHTVV